VKILNETIGPGTDSPDLSSVGLSYYQNKPYILYKADADVNTSLVINLGYDTSTFALSGKTGSIYLSID
jgi:hypothetical protein